MFFLLAQASSGITAVPADFIKYLVICLGFGASLWFGYRKGGAAKGTREEPVNIAQPLEVRQAPEWASSTELESLEARMEAMARENLRQHNAHAERLNASIQAGSERENTIIKALHEMEARMTAATIKEIKDIHQRLNPVAEQTQSNSSAIKAQETRLADMWQWLCRLADQIANIKPKRS